jgi:hypothetical protein
MPALHPVFVIGTTVCAGKSALEQSLRSTGGMGGADWHLLPEFEED